MEKSRALGLSCDEVTNQREQHWWRIRRTDGSERENWTRGETPPMDDADAAGPYASSSLGWWSSRVIIIAESRYDDDRELIVVWGGAQLGRIYFGIFFFFFFFVFYFKTCNIKKGKKISKGETKNVAPTRRNPDIIAQVIRARELLL